MNDPIIGIFGIDDPELKEALDAAVASYHAAALRMQAYDAESKTLADRIGKLILAKDDAKSVDALALIGARCDEEREIHLNMSYAAGEYSAAMNRLVVYLRKKEVGK